MNYNLKFYQEDTRFIKKDLSEISDKKILFFTQCEHFFNNTCSSTSWGPKSICHNCYKEKKYTPFSLLSEKQRGA